jgi:hypothetical protein
MCAQMPKRAGIEIAYEEGAADAETSASLSSVRARSTCHEQLAINP